MSVVPRKQSEKIEWCENRVTQWTSNAVAMGSSAAEVAEFSTRTSAARAALAAAEIARAAAKDATLILNNAIDALDISAGGIVKQVRVKAETTNNPGVYALASIPAPAIPSAVGNPGKPYQPSVLLKQNGTLDLGWKCNNPAGCTGVIYQVYRKIGSTGAYEYLGGAGERKFVDLTVPQGVATIIYQVQGTRSTNVGEYAEFTVNFGVSSGGTMSVSVSDATAAPTKIAA